MDATFSATILLFLIVNIYVNGLEQMRQLLLQKFSSIRMAFSKLCYLINRLKSRLTNGKRQNQIKLFK